MKIGATNFSSQVSNNYRRGNLSGNEDTAFKQTPVGHKSNGYHLRIGSEGDEAMTATGFLDGSSLSIFKSQEYSSQNPVMLVKYWDKDGKVQEIEVNAKEIDPSNANYMEMLALSAYYNEEGISKNSIGSFMTSNIGLDGMIKEETYSSLVEKRNFMEQVKEWEQMQYSSGNLLGYQQFSKYYELLSNHVNSIK